MKVNGARATGVAVAAHCFTEPRQPCPNFFGACACSSLSDTQQRRRTTRARRIAATAASMNGFPPIGAPTPWKEATDAAGKKYYYNSATQATQWDKPVELMNEQEVSACHLRWTDFY